MNGRMLNMLLAEDNIGGIFGAFPIIKTIMIVIMILCALFIICVVLFQPSNSSGVGAVAEKDELHIALEEGILEILGILFVFEGNKCLGFDSRQIEYYAGLNTSKARK